MNKMLNDSLDRLAALYEYGALQASAFPSLFIDEVAAEVTRLREENKQLLQALSDRNT